MRRRGMVPDSRTISLENVHAGPQVARALNISPDARVFRIGRLRLADDLPMAVETLHVPVSLVPGLTAAQLEHSSFYALLEERYFVVIASGLQTIEPTVTNEEESRLLDVPLHSPAFLFERTSTTTGGETVEFVRSIYRGDRYRLVAELSHRREPAMSALPALDGG
jgi:GntR family transcriptional regulator